MKQISDRGVYYDLSLSPYEYVHPYIDRIYKFQSAKKKDMFLKHVATERVRYQKIIAKLDFLSMDDKVELNNIMNRQVYDIVYNKIAGVIDHG